MKHELSRIEEWLEIYLEKNASPDAPIIVGLSGGKDSTITAALCAKVVGKKRVIGVSMPDWLMGQTSAPARNIATMLGIRLETFPIDRLIEEMIPEDASTTVRWNLPPRLRMTILYIYANQLGGRVANTCNLSESYVGYDTRWGDQCGDFSLFQDYTATEVRELGRLLGLSPEFTDVPPSDGLCGMTDEERWGFTYAMLDSYLRGRKIPSEIEEKIEAMHKRALYKIRSINLPGVPYFPRGSKKLRD